MKLLRIAVAAVFAGAFGSAYAFHSGGVAECEGCHTMHNTVGRSQTVLARGVGNGAIYLLQGTDQSSTCLNCHNSPDATPSGYHVSTDESMITLGLQPYATTNKGPVELTPGGDFAWLKVDRLVTIRGAVTTVYGEERGHNVIASDFHYAADARADHALSPGGSYPATSLTCISCHDPHGRYRRDSTTPTAYATTGLPIFNSGSYNTSKDPIPGIAAVGAYRILGGLGYTPKSVGTNAFTTQPPDAVAPSSYNRTEALTQTVVAYGQGMSEWCGNCHGAMVESAYVSGAAGHRHPAGNGAKLTQPIVDNYSAYLSSGKMTGVIGTSYSTLAPFEIGTNNYANLKPAAGFGTNPAVATTANVNCLSCHRAHASAFVAMTRYFLDGEFMTTADASNAGFYDTGVTDNKVNYALNTTEQTNAYYGRPATVFGPYARNYCNKCHAKD